MSDDKTKRRPQDASRVNIHEPYEVTYWTSHFNCTKDELIAAVHEVGTYVSAIEKYFNNRSKNRAYR